MMAGMTKIFLTGTILFASMVATASCLDWSRERSSDPSEIVLARLDGRELTLEMLNRELKRYQFLNAAALSSDEALALRKGALDRLIDQTILQMEADRVGIEVSEEEIDRALDRLLGSYDEARLKVKLAERASSIDEWVESLKINLRIEKLIARELDDEIEISPEAAREYYESSREEFKKPAGRFARQIVLTDETTAIDVLRQLRGKGGKKKSNARPDFAAIAKERSVSPDALKGGDMGFISRGLLPIELEDAIFALKKGEISGVVRSPYGYHIFELTGIEQERELSFEEARPRIVKILFEREREERFQKWMSDLKKTKRIEIFADRLESAR